MGAAHAPAQLMQLGQAQLVGAVDDDGVGGGDIDAALDDGGAQQQVEAAVVEVQHDLFQVAFAHLAVADGDAGLGDQLGEFPPHALDGLDLVVQEVHLAAPLDLAQAGLAQGLLVPLGDEGLDGGALRRRRGDDGQVAQPGQGHV